MLLVHWLLLPTYELAADNNTFYLPNYIYCAMKPVKWNTNCHTMNNVVAVDVDFSDSATAIIPIAAADIKHITKH